MIYVISQICYSTSCVPMILQYYSVIQNLFLTAQSTQIKSVISVPIKDCIHHYPMALFNDIPRVGAYFYDIPGSGHTFTTYPGRSAVQRHTRVKYNSVTKYLNDFMYLLNKELDLHAI